MTSAIMLAVGGPGTVVGGGCVVTTGTVVVERAVVGLLFALLEHAVSSVAIASAAIPTLLYLIRQIAIP